MVIPKAMLLASRSISPAGAKCQHAAIVQTANVGAIHHMYIKMASDHCPIATPTDQLE
jgi:hypothetical protein